MRNTCKPLSTITYCLVVTEVRYTGVIMELQSIIVTVSEKTDHLAQVSDFKIFVVARNSLYATVKSELR